MHFFDGELEIRRRGGGSVLSGAFRYGRTATISDRGRVRKERIGRPGVRVADAALPRASTG